MDKTDFKLATPEKLLEQINNNDSFARYFDLLTEWNAKFNLTAITDKKDVYIKHFLDSVLPVSLFPFGCSVLDVGAGAGFPGICLKLLRPDLNITLLDSVGKKVTFLNTVIDSLRLCSIAAKKSRIEGFARRDFDIVTARAVAATNVLAEYCLPFVKIGGFALFYKSALVSEELSVAANAISVLGGAPPKIIKMQLSPDTERHFVLIEKIKNSPAIYPRGGNKPRLSPLL